MHDIEKFSAYLLAGPESFQGALDYLRIEVLHDQNIIFAAVTEKTKSEELYVIANSGLSEDSIAGLGWLNMTSEFPTIECLALHEEIYLPTADAWRKKYPASELFRQTLEIEEMFCFPMKLNPTSNHCLTLAFKSRPQEDLWAQEKYRSLSHLLSIYLQNVEKKRVISIEMPQVSIRRRIANLSTLQQKIVTEILEGKDNQQISQDLDLNINTLKRELKKIFKELHISQRTQIYAKILDES